MPRPYIPPSAIHPFPKAAERKKTKGGRKKGSSKISTATPERQELAALSGNRKRKISAKKTKKCLFSTAGKKTPCSPRLKTLSSSETETDDD
ncbi:hypothetical protein ElyMa_006633200 [Elysia marginata]|uniref:Uncharacterized protein n=1 Tax=Elysia marginata TaxID=1093978 RepID=A0AAV4ILT7_9GAST|nr:hypothetical protein ElyMa_006633200 [Elysia marginata]